MPRSHHATSTVVLGQRTTLWPKVHIALVEGQHGDTPLVCIVGLTNGEQPEDASVAIQAQLVDPVKMVQPPLPIRSTHTEDT